MSRLVLMLGLLVAPLSQPTPEPFVPREIGFWDAKQGLVAGSALTSDGHWGDSIVRSTSDGGRTWRDVLRTSGEELQLSVVRAGRHAWLATRRGVFRSGDRGRSWRLVSRRFLTTISFASARVGWATAEWRRLEERPRLLATRDGGRTWQGVRAPCSPHLAHRARIALATSRRGWIVCVGQPATAMSAKAVYETRDGGRSWLLRSRNTFSSSTAVGRGLWALGHPRGLSFLANGHGWLWNGRGDFLATADGGRSWRVLPISRPEVVEAFSASLFSAGVGVALFYGYKLLATGNGGRTWRLVYRWRPRPR